jgi:hypothetical protein
MIELILIAAVAWVLIWGARLLLVSRRDVDRKPGGPVRRPFWRMMGLRAILVCGLLLLFAVTYDGSWQGRNLSRYAGRRVDLSTALIVVIGVIVLDALWDCLRPSVFAGSRKVLFRTGEFPPRSKDSA